MIKATDTRKFYICIHEAAHCLARWYFGFRTDKVTVNTDREILERKPIRDRAGREIVCHGHTDASDITIPDILEHAIREKSQPPHVMRCVIANAEIALIECLSGPFAEARYRKISTMGCIWMGGANDLRQTTEILKAISSDPETQRLIGLTAEKRTSALLRSAKGWKSINVIAAKLQIAGLLTGDEISNICSEVYGSTVPYSVWSFHWPPTINQLLEGHIPDAIRADSVGYCV